ncbi:hypothetical protein E4U36_006720, partial [Claviceps purpurea]
YLEVDGESTQRNGNGSADAETAEPDISVRPQPNPASDPAAVCLAVCEVIENTKDYNGQWTSSGLPVDFQWTFSGLSVDFQWTCQWHPFWWWSEAWFRPQMGTFFRGSSAGPPRRLEQDLPYKSCSWSRKSR